MTSRTLEPLRLIQLWFSYSLRVQVEFEPHSNRIRTVQAVYLARQRKGSNGSMGFRGIRHTHSPKMPEGLVVGGLIYERGGLVG